MNGRRWAISGAATLAAGALAVIGGATAANADTASNGPLMSIGQYAIPSTSPQPYSGATLPTTPGQVGEPVTIRMHGTGDDSETVSVPDASTSWGTPTHTENIYYDFPVSNLVGQTWVFQNVGYVDVRDATAAHADATEGTHGQLQQLPVYKIIQYHSDGSHTCLDGFGGDPLAGAAVDSYGCDVNGFDQTNQLWVLGTPDVDAPMTDAHGDRTGESLPEQLSDTVQQWPLGDDSRSGWYDGDTVIENLASLQAYSWSTANPALDTRVAPVMSASTPTDASGVGEPVTLQLQNAANVSYANSGWNISSQGPDDE